MNKLNGFLYGIISSASFGLIPLFAIPAMQHGMDFMNVISYRFLFATISLAVLLKIRKVSFGIQKSDLPTLLLLSFFYIISSVFLLWGYKFMPSGVATTIHFMYPVVTTVIMMLFFREKNSVARSLAILMAIAGVYSLSYSDSKGETDLLGVVIVLISAVGYALYLVAVGQRKNQSLKGLKLTFYVFLFSTIILLAGMLSTGNMHPIPDYTTAGNLLLLAIIPTIVSNLTLIEAIKYIGATRTSVLGAMEPVTAVVVGIAVFGETFTVSIAIGIMLIVSAVTIIILKKH
ncbi:EamA family transporter [uncultured Bacteroides sp.]|uniref:DMT family transporter n=1 Tax=uncultured Bacteroides sp. TaxID=162156 RepID=UPI0027D9BCC0|nr:EamA family transporter [uncultured Bacteroides sp.]